VLDQDQLAIAVKRGKEIKRTGSTSEPCEYKLRTKSGNYVWVEVESSLIYRGGKPYAIQGIARDVTERKQAEEQIRQSQQRFQGLVETLSDWIWEVDQNGIYTYASPKVRDLLGYKPEELLGKMPFDFMPIEEAQRVKGIFEQLQAARQPLIALENINRHKDGHLVVLETSGIPFFDTEGRFKGYRGVDRDITGRKHAEEALQSSYQQLRETFISTVNALASTVEMKDPYTAGHQRWATRLACAIAKEMGLSEERIEGIRMAGLIHDIGKINIPAEILSKPGQLSDIQYNMVKIHAQVGCDILREIKFPWPVAEIVLQHHERMNGSGYPERRSGDEIILEARILAVADTVEAMASHRPYRVAYGIESALEEISQNRGTLYDPAVVDACLTLFEKGFRFD
jgi:PAS domain S-box-containing protein/putative nucleotidyltransferase with HDIG domain